MKKGSRAWWAYRHMDGTFYFIRCSKNYIVDMASAEVNPVVLQVYTPIEAKTLVEAQRKFKEKLILK